jgi:hypothetical protein
MAKMRAAVLVVIASNFTQARYGDPTAEPNKRNTRKHAEQLSVVLRESETAQPNDCSDKQRRESMPNPRDRRRFRSLPNRPSPLTREQRYRRPMIGHQCMKSPDDRHGDDQKISGGYPVHLKIPTVATIAPDTLWLR